MRSLLLQKSDEVLNEVALKAAAGGYYPGYGGIDYQDPNPDPPTGSSFAWQSVNGFTQFSPND